MKKETRFKFGLRAKLTVIFILFGTVISGATILYMERIIQEIYKEHYNEVLTDIAETAAEHLKALGVGAEEIKAYMLSGVLDERYEQVHEKMKEIRERFELESLYIIYPTGEYTALWFADASVEDEQEFGGTVEDYEAYESRYIRGVYESGKASEEMDWTTTIAESGADGEQEEKKEKIVWRVISAYYPIRDQEGNSVAVLGVDKTELEMKEKIRSSLTRVTQMIFFTVAILSALLILFVQQNLVRPIRRLKRTVQELGDGGSNVHFPDGRRDELGEIARAFNRMADSIGQHIGEMEKLNGAYQKLLPPGIFELLHKKALWNFILAIRRTPI